VHVAVGRPRHHAPNAGEGAEAAMVPARGVPKPSLRRRAAASSGYDLPLLAPLDAWVASLAHGVPG